MNGLKIDKEDKPLIETIKRKKWFTRPLDDLHMRITTYIKPKERRWCNIENYKKGIDSLVFAVCGSPKTRKT